MSKKSSNLKDTKLLQIYISPELHKALGMYCLDNNTKNAPIIRKLLTRFLELAGYLNEDACGEDLSD